MKFDNLDTPSGHILVCLVLIFTGVVAAKFGFPKADEIVVFSLGALGRSMLGSGRKSEQGGA